MSVKSSSHLNSYSPELSCCILIPLTPIIINTGNLNMLIRSNINLQAVCWTQAKLCVMNLLNNECVKLMNKQYVLCWHSNKWVVCHFTDGREPTTAESINDALTATIIHYQSFVFSTNNKCIIRYLSSTIDPCSL